MAWTYFVDGSRDEFRRGLPFDDATWTRARGWARWKALITILRERDGGEAASAAARRFGWRHSPLEVVELVVADQRRWV